MRSLIAIQEGQISIEQIKVLEAMLRTVYADHVGDEKLTIIWNVAAKQHTITDRRWSRSSTITMEVPDGFEIERRQALLLAIEPNWRKITGQHPDQIAVGAFDKSNFTQILKGNLTRFSTFGKLSYLARMMFRVMVSKRRHGVTITQFNQ